MNTRTHQYAVQRGFTLIEVMVAVFVVAVGALGVAGMQAFSVRESANLYYRSQADLLIADMVDRMRANRVAARGNGQGGGGSPYDGASTSGFPSTNACVTGNCSPAQLAAFDVARWAEALQAAKLPSAWGHIDHVSDILDDSGQVVGAVYSLQLAWDENREGNLPSSIQDCRPGSAVSHGCRQLAVTI